MTSKSTGTPTLVALLLLTAVSVDSTSAVPTQGGDGSSGSLNLGTPKSDGQLVVDVGYSQQGQGGEVIPGLAGGISITVNGPPTGPDDEPLTGAAGKALLLAEAINDYAKGSDGEEGTGDDVPIEATAIGDTCVVLATGPGGKITSLGYTDSSGEFDYLQLSPTPGVLVGSFELDGLVSAVPKSGGLSTVTLQVGGQVIEVTTQPEQRVEDVLDELTYRLLAAGISANRDRGRVLFRPDFGVSDVGSEANDRTLSVDLRLFRL